MASTIGPYRLLRVLGRGSMGAVHLALDSRTQQPLALKLLDLGRGLSEAERAQVHERFLAEAATAQRLAHPDIIAIHAAGESDGQAWLAMELASGSDLGRYTRMPRLLPEAVVLQVGERLARALAHAHAQGVVHRDVKPGNVMFDLVAGRLKLMDFGVAALADLSRTRTGVVLGTPAYMAPEQLAGAAADARSDIYSLGVLLFELLSGRLPHDQASLGELLRAVAREPAPDLCRLRPELPPALAAVVARSLSKRPSQRQADAGNLADELAALQQLSADPGKAGAGA